MSSKILCLSIFFLVPTWAAGQDCESSDGYIRDHQGNVTDNCDYECGWWQCGDVCVSAITGDYCYCGEKKLNIIVTDYYCCVDHSPDNRTQCSVDRDGNGNGHCPQGRVVSQYDTCNNHCFNDYETSAVSGWRSRYRCGSGDIQCLLAQNMCRGYPVCPDSSDVSECDEDLKCALRPGVSHSNGILVSELSGGHHYCDYDFTHNDGQYDTITREDETDLNIMSRKVQINYTSITVCNNSGSQFNLPGLMCGEQCVEHRLWCLGGRGGSCGNYNFSANNEQLCANTKFWAGKTCDVFYSSGYKAGVGRRCTGAAQHCSYPWYTIGIYYFEVSVFL